MNAIPGTDGDPRQGPPKTIPQRRIETTVGLPPRGTTIRTRHQRRPCGACGCRLVVLTLTDGSARIEEGTEQTDGCGNLSTTKHRRTATGCNPDGGSHDITDLAFALDRLTVGMRNAYVAWSSDAVEAVADATFTRGRLDTEFGGTGDHVGRIAPRPQQ